MKFIKAVLDNEITINKIKEEVIKENMEKLKIPYLYYEKSKTRDFSEESLIKYKKMLEDSKIRLSAAKETTANTIWLEKLELLKTEILKRKKGKFFDFNK